MAAIVIVIPNQNHVFPVNPAGIITNTSGSGTDLFVYLGKNKLDPVSEITADSQYTVEILEQENIAAGNITIDSDNKKFILGEVNTGVMANFSAQEMANKDSMAEGKLTLLFTIRDDNSNLTTATRELTYKKSTRFIENTVDVEVGTVISVRNTLNVRDGIEEISTPKWFRDGQEISETSSYTIQNDDVGHTISASITYKTTKGVTKTKFIVKNVNVIDSAPINYPVITGTPALEGALGIDTSFIYDRNGVGSFEHSWFIDDALVAENVSTYTIPDDNALIGKSIKVQSTYEDYAGTLNTLESPSIFIYDTSVSDQVVLLSDTVNLQGQAEIGTVISASIVTGDSSTPGNVEFQWRRNGVVIPSQTGATYTVRKADTGKNISVTARYEVAGAQRMKASEQIEFKNSEATGAPFISYATSEDSMLQAMPTDISIGEELEIFTSGIQDPNGIKDPYYPFDDFVSIQMTGLEEEIVEDNILKHNAIRFNRTYIPGAGLKEDTTEIIELSQNQQGQVQSIWINNRFGSFSDVITIQYMDENDQWNDAAEMTGPNAKFHILEESVSYSKWRAKFSTTADYISFNYSLEMPGTEDTKKFIYEWIRVTNGSEQIIRGARNKKYTIKGQDVDSQIKAKVYFTDEANQTKSLTTANTIPVVGYAFAGSIIIDGSSFVGGVLEVFDDITDADNVTLANTEGTVDYIDSYEWSANGTVIEGQTSSTLPITSNLAGKTISARLFYTDATGKTNSANAQNTVVVNSPVTGTPRIVGTPKVGRTLFLNTTSVSDDNGISQRFYQWIRVDEQGNEEEIENAGTSEYLVKAEDVTKYIKGVLYFTDLDGFSEVVASSPLKIEDTETTGQPVISGNIVSGFIVTADTSSINDENGIQSISYQWRINEQEVSGANNQNFEIPPSFQISPDSVLDVVTEVTDSNGIVKTLYSEDARIATLATTATPDQGNNIIDDNLTVQIPAGAVSEDINIVIYETESEKFTSLPEGSTLTGSAWVFTPHGTTFDTPITLTFTVPEGSNIILRADSENSPYFEIVENAYVQDTTASVETDTFSIYVAGSFTPAVITGTPEQGYYLTASMVGDITDVDFQWIRETLQIEGATGSTYQVQLEDVGSRLAVDATYTDSNNLSQTRRSLKTTIVNSAPEGSVSITGSLRVGSTLTAVPNNVTDRNIISGAFEYQWYKNNLQIQDANSSTYVIQEDDYLSDITVRLLFTDSAGKQEQLTSPLSVVSKTGDVFLQGGEAEGEKLEIITTELQDLYRIYDKQYQWYGDGQLIPGATQKERTLSTIESGKNISVVLTYTDGRNQTEVLETEQRFVHTIKATITPAGGEFSNQGVTLSVPSGAVTQNTDILVYVVPYSQDQLPIGILSDQVGYAFTPLDLTFQQPVEITLPKPNDEYDMIIYGSNNSVDEFTISDDDFITVDNENNKVKIQTENFGVFVSSILYVRVDIIGTPEQGQVLDTVFTGEVFSKSYQWYRGESPILDATGSNYTVTLQDVAEELKVISTYLLEADSGPEIVESEPITILNSQPVADTSIIISGSDRVGEILTADPSGITDANNPAGLSDFMYQWKVQGQDIEGATSDTLTIQPEHFNKNLTVEITYVDATGLLETVSSDNFFVSRIPPSGFVEVIGTPEVGEYLEVDTDNLVDLNGIGEFSYQWHVEGEDLENAVSSSLLVTSDMEDKAISVTLVYTDGVGEVETVTSQNALVIDAHPTGEVTIDYTILEVAQTLTANTSTIQDANSPNGISSFSYQWKSEGAPIAGANSVNYVVANQFCNTNITVTVTFTDGDGYVETLTSEPVFIVNSPVQGQPLITGYPGVGETLTINTDGRISDVNVIGALNYKWFADGVEISGATEKEWFVDQNLYVGQTITGEVYYTDGAGNSEQVTSSNGLTITNTLPTGQPTIEGVLKVGQTLTALTGAIADANIIVPPFSYQWYANGSLIQDATGSDYIVQVDDINKSITVNASFFDEGNTFETVSSVGYTITNTPASGTVLITYTGLEQGDILSSSVITQDDNIRVSDYSYQWKRDGQIIAGANSSTYELQRWDWQKDVTLTVSFTDTGGFVESFDSQNSVQMINSSPSGSIQITGSNKVGEVVEADISAISDRNELRSYDYNGYPLEQGGYSSLSFSFDYGRSYSSNIHYYNIDGHRIVQHHGRNYWNSFLTLNEAVEVSQINAYSTYGWALRNIYVYYRNSTAVGWTLAKYVDTGLSTGHQYGSQFRRHPIVFDTPIVAKYWQVRMRAPGSEFYGAAWNIVTGIEGDLRFNYQWNRDGQPISGSTEKTYTTTFDDLYKTLTVDVTYLDGNGQLETPNNSASFDIVNSPPEGTVLINGTRNVGESLYFTHNVVDRDNVTVDNPTGLVTFSSYQWYQSDFEDGELTPISGAVSASLLLTPELQAKWIALDATYVDIEGDDDTIHASNRLPVKSPPTGNAVITSIDAQMGRQVFLDTSTIADQNDLGEFSYQWYRTEGTGSIAISGAVQTHYSFQPADLGEDIFVTVSYVDGDGDQEVITSNAIGPILQTSGSVGTITIDSSSEINGEITSDVENIFAMNNFETVAPVVAYNFHNDTKDVSPNGLHLAGTNYAFDADGGLDLSHSTSAYLRTNGTTPVLNNDTHTIAFRVMMKGGISSAQRKVFSFGRSNAWDGNPEIWWWQNTKKLEIDYIPETSGIQTSDLEPDTWYDLMFVKQGSVCRVYVDGSLVNEYTGLPNPKSTGDYKLEFGGNSGYQAAPVIIKDFQIFDFAVDDYTSATNYPFYTEPTLSYQWKADGNPIAGETNSTLQLTGGNNDLGKDITLEVSLTDALGNARTVESNASVVVGSELVQVEKLLLEDGSEMLQEDGSSFLSETTTDQIIMPLSINGQDIVERSDVENEVFVLLSRDDQADNVSFKDYSLLNHSVTRTYGEVVNTDEQSKFSGRSLKFDGSGDRLYIPHDSSLNIAGGDWTIEAWIYPDGNYGNYRTIISKRDSGYQEWQLYLRTGNGVLSFYNGTQYNSSVTPAANQWSHVAAVRSGTTVTLYLNGESVASWNNIDARNSTRHLYVGSVWNANESFSGYIDSIRVTKEALYTQNFDIPTEEFAVIDNAYVEDIISVDTSNVADPNTLVSTEYQWYADNVSILDATGSSYVITQDEINKDIFVKAVFEDATGRKSARLSNEVLVVNTLASASIEIVSTGDFEVNNVLLANVTASDANGITTDFDYQWYRNGSSVSGQTNRSYIITNSDVNKNISVRIQFVDKGNTLETFTSDSVLINDSQPTGEISIDGLARVASILSANTDGIVDQNGINAFSYQWRREGVDISGATSKEYTLVADDYEKNISVYVSYTDNVGTITVPANTASVYVDSAVPTGIVEISGTRKVLNTLTAQNTIDDLDGVGTLVYQWYLNDKPIIGATSQTYDIPYGHEGQDVHVAISYTDGKNNIETVISEKVQIDSEVIGQISIVGDPRKDQELTVDLSGLTDANSPREDLTATRTEGFSFELDAQKYYSRGYAAEVENGLTEPHYYSGNTTIQYTHGGYWRMTDSSNENIQFHSNQIGNRLDFAYNNFTIELLVKNENQGSFIQPDRTYNNSSTAYWHIAINNGKITFARHGTNGKVEFADDSIVQDEWYHIIITRVGSEEYVLYLNGRRVEASYNNIGNVGWYDDGLAIGVISNYDYKPAQVGLVRFYLRDLTAEEIQANYKSSKIRVEDRISYQWSREVSEGVYEDISNAKLSMYKPSNSDVNKNIKVTAVYTDEAGFEHTLEKTIFVQNSLPQGSISFSGTMKVGNTITSNITNIVDANGYTGVPTYQWKLNGIPVGGDSTNYTIASSDTGKELSLTITFVDNNGVLESVTTSAGVVQNTAPSNTLAWSEPYKYQEMNQVFSYIGVVTSDRYAQEGESVAMSGNGRVMVSGAPNADGNYSNNYSYGWFVVYEKDDDGTWNYVTRIQPSGVSSYYYAGYSVSVNHDGSVIAVGGYGYDASGYDRAGGVWIYKRNTSNIWQYHQTISASDVQSSSEHFGWSVSLSKDGSTLAVGAVYKDNPADSGAVYIYKQNEDGTYGTEQKIQASDKYNNDNYGSSVALNENGTVLAVGAPYEDQNAADNGAVYVYHKNQNNIFDSEQKIKPNDYYSHDHFGNAVSLSDDGSVLAVGSRYEDHDVGSQYYVGDSGAVYVYRKNQNNIFDSEQKIKAYDRDTSDHFGWSVSLSGDGASLAVGSRYWDGTHSNQGAVYIYRNIASSSFILEKRVQASDQYHSDYFGWSVSLSGDGTSLAVGAPRKDNYYSDIGKIYIFETEDRTDTSKPQFLCEGSEISIDSSTIFDVDGMNLASEKYLWYRLEDGEYREISQNQKYIIDSSDVGKTLKARYEYVDLAGKIENLDLIVNIPSNSLTFDKALNVGNEIFLQLSDTDEMSALDDMEAEWRVDGEIVSTNGSYVLKPSDLGKKLEANVKILKDGRVYRRFEGSGTVGIELHSSLTYEYIQPRYVVNQNNNLPSEKPSANIADTTVSNYYGYGSSDISISGDGNTLAIGSYREQNDSYDDEGAIYIFTKQEDGTWGNEVRISPQGIRQEDLYFGTAFRLNEDGTVLVSVCQGYDNGSYNRGAIFIYRKDENGNWNEEHAAMGPFIEWTVGFGANRAVDISNDGNVIVVGAMYADEDYNDSDYYGRIVVYEKSGNTWNTYIHRPNWNSYRGYYGRSVAIDPTGNYIVVGHYAMDYGNTDDGIVEVIKRNNLNSWSRVQILTMGIAGIAYYEQYAYFGWSVDVSENAEKIVIGAAYADETSSHNYHGRAYVFAKTSSTSWAWHTTLQMPETYYGSDYFGDKVAISDDGKTIYVSAYRARHLSNTSYYGGSVTRFEPNPEGHKYLPVAYYQSAVNNGSSYFGNYILRTTSDGTAIVTAENYHAKVFYTGEFSGFQIENEELQITKTNIGGYHEKEVLNYNHISSTIYDSDFPTSLDTINKITVDIPYEEAASQLEWKWFIGDRQDTSVTGSSLVVNDEVRSYGKVRFEYSYTDYQGEVHKQSGMIHLVDTATDYLEQITRVGSSFSLDLDNVIDDNRELEIVGVELLGGFGLPSWLSYNSTSHVLSGVPGENDANNLSIRIKLRNVKAYGSVDYGVVLKLRVMKSGEDYTSSYKGYDWVGADVSAIGTYGLSSTRRWSGKIRLDSTFEPLWNEESVMQENFDTSDWNDLRYQDSYDIYETINTGSIEEEYSFIQEFELTPSRVLTGGFQWHNRPNPSFEELSENILEENFDDVSWDGYSKFDWTDIEDPATVASSAELNGYSEFENKFAWKDIPVPAMEENSVKLFEEKFEDDTWTGYTSVDWTNVEDPVATAADYEIEAYWSGIHDWQGNPEPQFAEDRMEFDEQFEDPTWSGYTRIDWTDTENPETLADQYGLDAQWEGQLKWSERAQPSFSEKSLRTEEDFEDDWTI